MPRTREEVHVAPRTASDLTCSMAPCFGKRPGSFFCALALVILAAIGCRQETPLQRYSFDHAQMGTNFRVVLYASDSLLARNGAEEAFRRIDTLNQRLSDYLVDSELNNLSASAGSGESVPVSDDLWTVLAAAQNLSAQTQGAFDVTVGPATKLWRWAIRRNQLPPPDRLADAQRSVGFGYVLLDSSSKSVQLAKEGMRLDLGGIAKGYAVDEALAVLQSHDLSRALVDGGGDIRLGDAPPESDGWRIELPGATASGEPSNDEQFLQNVAVATSGATYRFVEVDGVRYSHILDPRTGKGLTTDDIVTVIAPTGMLADALASGLSVMGRDQGQAFASTMPGVTVQFVQRDRGGSRTE